MTFSLSLVTQSFTTADATSLPSGEKATELTPIEWPSSGSPCGAPVAASQSLTVSSSEPDATSLPSGEKATEPTPIEWPLSVCSGDKFLAFPTCTAFLIQGYL